MQKKLIISNIKGGFGNQLLQYATGMNLARKNNSILKVDLSFFNEARFRNAFRLNMMNIDYIPASEEEIKSLRNREDKAPVFFRFLTKFGFHNPWFRKTHVMDTQGFCPSDSVINANPPVYIEGWCTKENYFAEIREELKKSFTPRNRLTEHARTILNKVQNCISVSIHIRMKDYVGNPVFKLLPLEYYLNAISYIKNNIDDPVFFVFSDDLKQVRENLKSIPDLHFVDLGSETDYKGDNDIEDFFLMSKCKHHINANSSFSWWASYLSTDTNSISIVPSIWFIDPAYQESLEKCPFWPSNWVAL
jgi:hypothetical protein